MELLDKGTLHEAIANDRRITNRNVYKWIDQVLNTMQVYHRSFASIGEFSILDVNIGYSHQLKDSVAFGENLLATFKANQHAVEALKLKIGDPEKILNDGERIAAVDFRRRIQAYQSSLSDKANSQELVRSNGAPTARSTLPRGFEIPKMLKFDFKHDNNVCIPKDNGEHHSLVQVYHEYVRSVCQDYRCLGIIILQIFSLSVFSADECHRLMNYQAPEPPPKMEEAAEEESPPPPQQRKQSIMTTTGLVPPGSAEGGRRASVSVGRRASVTAATVRNNTSPARGTKTSSIATATGTGTSAATGGAATTGTAAAGAAPAVAVEPKKKRPPRVPNPVEQELLQTYPCIARMPAEIKELFLTLCFVRPADVLLERTIKTRGELCTKFEFTLLPLVKKTKVGLRSIVEQLQQDAHYEPQSCWTEADERARLAAHKAKADHYAMLAQQGPLNAERRLQHDKYLLWYSLQSEDFRIKLEARNKARRKAEKNVAMRRKFIYLASFHRWSMLNFTSWVHEALYEYSVMLQGLRHTVQLDKKKKRKPAVYVTRLINDLLAVYTKTAVAKLVAYRDKRYEEDSVGWEASIVLIKPSTSGGRRPGTRGESLTAAPYMPSGVPMPVDPFADDGSVHSSMTKGSLVSKGSRASKGTTASKDSSAANKPAKLSAPPLPPMVLPDIRAKSPNRSEVKSRNNGRQKKVVEVVKVKTEEEILLDCFNVLASQLARLITQKLRDPFDTCWNMRQSIKAQENETAEAISERMLITSEEQLYYKRLSMQAGYFTSYTKHIRGCVVDFSDTIDLMDRGWVKFVVYLISSAIMHQFHRDAPNRTRGEGYAADRIIAFFRRIVVRNIVSRVWQRTNLMYKASMSPQGSAKNSPALSLRKQSIMGLGSNSSDTRDSSGHHKRHPHVALPISSDHSLPTTKSAPPGQPKASAPERRKPFFIKDVQAPTGKSLLVEMYVSIESDEHLGPDTVNIRATKRQAARYEVWKNIQCFAYVETALAEERPGMPAKQVIADSGLFSASAFHASASTANIIPGKGLENPVPRRLVVQFGKKHTHHPEQHTGDHSVKRVPVKAALSVIDITTPAEEDATSLGDISLQSNTMYNAHSSYKTPGAHNYNQQERRQSAAELAWDERSVESATVGSGGAHQASAGQPVIAYHIELDGLLAYSNYTVQFVLDKHLAEDLKDGNKTFFHYLTHDEDDISMGSETVVQFTHVGKQWTIKEDEAGDDAASGSLMSGFKSHSHTDALTVELAQYVHTRPAIPRSVKGLAARVAYHSTDAAYEVLLADQAPMLQYSAAAHHKGVSEQAMKTLQGGVELRWLHSVEDNHSNTHYEVQRRLLLINTAQPAPALQLPPSRPSTSPNRRKASPNKKSELTAPVVPTPAPAVEEFVYVGPWKYVAGLKTSLRNANKSSLGSVTSAKSTSAGFSSKFASSIKAAPQSASEKSTASNADWSFLASPHHSTACTDRISLPAELDTNPDAYNLVMGYLCARFPDLLVQSADNHKISDATSAAGEHGDAHAALLQRVVESGLVIGVEYRVRAINSAGPGKFSACTANLPQQVAQTSSADSGKASVCTVKLARVSAHLGQLCEFRTQHPKYRSQNSDLVGTILLQRVITAKNAEELLIERSGDPFVEFLVDLKDGAVSTTPSGKTANPSEQHGNREAKEELDEIPAWIRSLELECPIK